jgi:hypothetical protein
MNKQTLKITLPQSVTDDFHKMYIKPSTRLGYDFTEIGISTSEFTWASDRIYIIQDLLAQLLVRAKNQEHTTAQLNAINTMLKAMLNEMQAHDDYSMFHEPEFTATPQP